MIIPKLYHGTDARLIEMSREQRLQYMNYCKLAIDYIFPFLEALYNDYITVDIVYKGQNIKVNKSRLEIEYKDKLDTVPYLYQNLIEKIFMISASRFGNEMYQYGALYLTEDLEKAKRYAARSFAGGEYGLLAYRLIQAIEIIKPDEYKPNNEVSEAINSIKTFTEDENLDNPVVITLTDIDSSDLLDEKGKPLTSESIQINQSFRYTKEVDLTLEGALFLKQKQY